MGNIIENKETVYDWDSEKVYLIEEDDYVEGGEDGVSNRQAKQLTSRTRDLFNRVVEILHKITKGDTDTLNAAKNYTNTKVASILDTAPETLNTLNELAAALGDDPNFATTVATQIGTKVDRSDPRLADARPASDVHPWAKAATKPSYSADEVGAVASTLNNRYVNNCNKYTQNGMYGFSDKPTNGPGPAYLSMLVVKNIETGYQLAGGYNSNKLFFRGIVTDISFTNWWEIFHSGNFNPATKVDTSDLRLADARPANGGNASSVGGSPAWRLQSVNEVGQAFGASAYDIQSRHNAKGDDRFRLEVTGSVAADFHKNNVSVGHADLADIATNAISATNAEVASSLRNFDPATKADTNDVMKVLRAGKFDANGAKLKSKGYLETVAVSVRGVVITHNIGHTNYITLVTGGKPAAVLSEETNRITVAMGDAFNIVIFEMA